MAGNRGVNEQEGDAGGLRRPQFGQLSDIPEIEWLAKLTHEKYRRAYKFCPQPVRLPHISVVRGESWEPNNQNRL